MLRPVSLLLSAALVSGVVACAHADDDAEQVAITAQAAALAPDDMPEAQRIMALHRFVRDEIRQIKTEYG